MVWSLEVRTCFNKSMWASQILVLQLKGGRVNLGGRVSKCDLDAVNETTK